MGPRDTLTASLSHLADSKIVKNASKMEENGLRLKRNKPQLSPGLHTHGSTRVCTHMDLHTNTSTHTHNDMQMTKSEVRPQLGNW